MSNRIRKIENHCSSETPKHCSQVKHSLFWETRTERCFETEQKDFVHENIEHLSLILCQATDVSVGS